MDRYSVIMKTVCSEFLLFRSDLHGSSRKYPLPDARKIAVKLLTQYTKYSHYEIAKLLGVTRSCVCVGWKRTKDRMQFDKHFRAQYETIKNKVDDAFKT